MSCIPISPFVLDIKCSRPLDWLGDKRPGHREVPHAKPRACAIYDIWDEVDDDKWSLRISATISSGDERNPPIGPHSQVQNASEMKTASALSSSLRPIMVGVMKWPSRKVSPTNASGAIKAAPMVENATCPISIRIANIATGPIMGR